MLNKTLLSFLILAVFLLNGCTFYRVHKIDIQQGNIIEQEKVNQLKPGMSMEQVEFIMGTPLLKDRFHRNRWDYIHTIKPAYGEYQKQRLSLYFNEGSLENMVGDFHPQAETTQRQKNEQVIVVPPELRPEAQKKWYQGWFDGFSLDALKFWEKDKN